MSDLDKAIEDIERNVISSDEMENIVQQLQNYKKQNEMIQQEKKEIEKELEYEKQFLIGARVKINVLKSKLNFCNKLLNIEENQHVD